MWGSSQPKRIAPACLEAAASEAGVVLVDALIGVVIVSFLIAVVVAAIRLVTFDQVRAQETRQAARTLSALSVIAPGHPGQYKGRLDGFTYSVSVTQPNQGDVTLCKFRIDLISAKKHHYRLVGLRTCEMSS